MATCSTILSWRIPWTEKPGRLEPMGSQRHMTEQLSTKYLYTYVHNSMVIINDIQSVQFSSSVVSNSLQPHGLQHARLPCLSPAPRACSNSYPSNWSCHPTISFSVTPFTSCFESFPASGSFPVNYFFTPGGQSIGVSPSTLILPMNIQDLFPQD